MDTGSGIYGPERHWKFSVGESWAEIRISKGRAQGTEKKNSSRRDNTLRKSPFPGGVTASAAWLAERKGLRGHFSIAARSFHLRVPGSFTARLSSAGRGLAAPDAPWDGGQV